MLRHSLLALALVLPEPKFEDLFKRAKSMQKDLQKEHQIDLEHYQKKPLDKETFKVFLDELEAAEKELDKQSYAKEFRFFPSTRSDCRKRKGLNCCPTGSKGVFQSLHVAKCNAAEKELVKLVKEDLCAEIAKDKHQKTFCCFGVITSKRLFLAAKKQLKQGLSCKGLTVQDVKKLDLDAMAKELKMSVEDLILSFTLEREKQKVFLENLQKDTKRAKEQLKKDGWL